jgi:DNA/RNA endonuclease YhcR with UshA esterase domain
VQKISGLILIVMSSVALASAQTAKPDATKKLTPAEAKEAVGRYATVVGVVVQVRPQEKVTHLNFEKPYPYQTFTAVVFAGKTNLFPNLDQLVAKTVEVRGKVEEYNGKPQIVLQAPHQLRVVGEPAADAKEKPPGGGKPPAKR